MSWPPVGQEPKDVKARREAPRVCQYLSFLTQPGAPPPPRAGVVAPSGEVGAVLLSPCGHIEGSA
eukprot:249930-Pyramimonas_sp.AAC.1